MAGAVAETGATEKAATILNAKSRTRGGVIPPRDRIGPLAGHTHALNPLP
jgi:hypothetical protein